MDALELYKVIGATLGFFATGAAIWDRVFRHRPSVSITASHDYGRSRVGLRIKNQAPFDIILEEVRSSSPWFEVNSANTIRASLGRVFALPAPILLGPQEERTLAIAELEVDGIRAEEATGRIRFEISWARTDHPFFHPPSVRIWSSADDLARRKLAAELWAEEQLEQRKISGSL